MSFNDAETLFHYIHFINSIHFLFLFMAWQQPSPSNIDIRKTYR